MYYGVSGYAADHQAWQDAAAAQAAWQTAKAALEAEWERYRQATTAAAAECATKEAAYARAVAERSAYAARYAADLTACRDRAARIAALTASFAAWCQQYGIKPWSPPACASVEQKATWAWECKNQLRGLGYVYTDVSRAPDIKSIVGRFYPNAVCALQNIPTCPGRLPTCENLGPPGALTRPTCVTPAAPPALTTLGPMPPAPGDEPRPPLEEEGPTLPPPPEVPEETPAPTAASFAIYGILALVVIGGGFAIYRTFA